MIKKPTVAVPAELFLKLARLYMAQPPEITGGAERLEVDVLERRAYRKVAQARRQGDA